MEDYSSLVSKVLNNEPLRNSLKDIIEKDSLNLVCNDWLEKLENNATYQDFLNESKNLWEFKYSTANYEYEGSLRPDFQVVTVGYCKLMKPYGNKNGKLSVMVMNSEPLKKIGQAMTSDRDQVQISNDLKFPFQNCSELTCTQCSTYAAAFRKKGYEMPKKKQPCIADIKVLTGKSVVNRFLSVIEETYDQMFMAILKLNVNVRYNFTDSNGQKSFRITGDVLDFIAFLEQKLKMNKTVNLGELMQLENEPKECAKLKNENDEFETFLKETVEDIEHSNVILEKKHFNDVNEKNLKNVTKRKFDEDSLDLENSKKLKPSENIVDFDIESFFLS